VSLVDSGFCADCGGTVDEHHDYRAQLRPEGCVCMPRDWRDPQRIPAPCTALILGHPDGLCKTCEHLKGCHRAPEGGAHSV